MSKTYKIPYINLEYNQDKLIERDIHWKEIQEEYEEFRGRPNDDTLYFQSWIPISKEIHTHFEFNTERPWYSKTNSVIMHLQQCFRAMRIGNDVKQKAIIIDHVQNINKFGKLEINRGWSLTMSQAEKALAKTGRDTRSAKKAKNYDINYSTMTDAEMINLANVKNPQFEKDIEHILSLPKTTDAEKIKAFQAMVQLQRKYKIVSPRNMPTWSTIMALRYEFATDNIKNTITQNYPNLIFY